MIPGIADRVAGGGVNKVGIEVGAVAVGGCDCDGADGTGARILAPFEDCPFPASVCAGREIYPVNGTPAIGIPALV